jgi:hypothetical protein
VGGRGGKGRLINGLIRNKHVDSDKNVQLVNF